MSMSRLREPWLCEQERQEQLEAHMAKFPVCKICGHSLMNCDTVIRIANNYYCDKCADVLTNDEMREAEDID